MANASNEQRELDLVDKVDFRIVAVANNEEKLQQLLKVYLPALLLKVASEHKSVQTKVSCPSAPPEPLLCCPCLPAPHRPPALTGSDAHVHFAPNRSSKYAKESKPSSRPQGT